MATPTESSTGPSLALGPAANPVPIAATDMPAHQRNQSLSASLSQTCVLPLSLPEESLPKAPVPLQEDNQHQHLQNSMHMHEIPIPTLTDPKILSEIQPSPSSGPPESPASCQGTGLHIPAQTGGSTQAQQAQTQAQAQAQARIDLQPQHESVSYSASLAPSSPVALLTPEHWLPPPHASPSSPPQPEHVPQPEPSTQAQSHQPMLPSLPTPGSAATASTYWDEFDYFLADLLEPDPRPTFVVKLPPVSCPTNHLKPQLHRQPTQLPVVTLPLTLFDQTQAQMQTTGSISTASISSALDDQDSGFSASVILPSSAPSAQSLDLEPPTSFITHVPLPVPALPVPESTSVSALVAGLPSLSAPMLSHFNHAFESSPAFAAVLDALKHDCSQGESRLDVRQDNLWKWILSFAPDTYSSHTALEDQTPTDQPARISPDFAQPRVAVHFGTPWTAYIVRRQWIVVSAKTVPQLIMPTVEVPASMGMAMSIPQDKPVNIPLPHSPLIHEPMFDCSTARSASTSTTSVDEIDESTILPFNDSNSSNHTKKTDLLSQTVPSSLIESDLDRDANVLENPYAEIDAVSALFPEETIDESESKIETTQSSKSDLAEIHHSPQTINTFNRDLHSSRALDLQQQLRVVANSLPIAICLSSPHGTINFANDEWYRISGMSREENHILSCVADEHRLTVETALEELDSQNIVNFQFRTRRRDNRDSNSCNTDTKSDSSEHNSHSERYITATAKAERRTNGRVIRVFTCLTDITNVTLEKLSSDSARRQAQDDENLKRMAQYASVGMYHIDRKGRIFSANDIFFQMTGQERVDLHETEVMLGDLAYLDEENKTIEDLLTEVAANGSYETQEMRLKTTCMAEDGYGGRRPAPSWVLVSVLPLRDMNGVVSSFTGCISDISDQKWQTERERQHKEEAIESKRQQETLIDMTSHEMRNPLGSIIQCADDIVNSLNTILEEFDVSSFGMTATLSDSPELPLDSSTTSAPSPITQSAVAILPRPIPSPAQARRLQMIEDCMEDAETIVECAQHQKRIVDDILTLSKLDAKLLMVTAVTADPVDMVNKAVKMFDAEARRVDVNMSFTVDKSFSSRGLSFLDFDPSRVTQVLINLLSNALKFTQGRSKRNITVCLKASDHRPEPPFSAVNFNHRLSRAPTNKMNTALAPHAEKSAAGAASMPEAKTVDNNSNKMYLLFEVEDTGKGLTEEEARSLFNRFYQGNSHTHVKYGGSGLGLFISRRLTELQHGAIGVKSKAGEGSTFAFYIETTLPPAPVVDEAKSAAAKSSKSLTAQRRERKLRKSAAPVETTAKDMHKRKVSMLSKIYSRTFPHKSSPTVAAVESIISSTSNVLVVEDNSINARVTKKALNDNGFNVEVVTNGAEAIDKLKSQSLIVKAVSSQLSSVSTGEPSHSLPSRAPVPTSFRSRRSSSTAIAAAPGTRSLGTRRTASSMSLNGLSSASSPSPSATPSPTTATATVPLPDPSTAIGMVLMDIEMPIKNGLDCTREIREMERDGRIVCASGGRIPIIAISGHARDEQVQRAREAGCDGVMVKPFRIPDLLEKMKTVFSAVTEPAIRDTEARLQTQISSVAEANRDMEMSEEALLE
ncbi:uncharacterized protein BROUX77_005017 [Berkeleyomyces rouxiae]|uniref:uncharacterized protein n=1 Tax=Berkeleyomyces rouxiae TaxID=2035830 RepID=UPI003B7FCBE7